MNNYVAILCTPAATMDQWMKTTDEATRKASTDKMMADWKVWADKHAANIVNQGQPLGKTKRVSKAGVADVRNDFNYTMYIQANGHDEAAAIFTDNPHITMIPDSYVEVMDVPHMGM